MSEKRPILVTGANGHLGNNLCRLLVARGERVRGMVRKSANTKPLEELGVELVYGDILDPDAVMEAPKGCSQIHHTAAGFLMWANDPERDIIRPSVDGTINVIRAALRQGVEKVTYTSTSGCMGFSKDPGVTLDESSRNEDPHTYYFQGKIAAEDAGFEMAAKEGLSFTAINPALIMGPRFHKVSESTRQVVDFVNMGVPVYFDGGFDVVDVEDVATGSILAMERGRDGERYLVSGESVTIKRSFEIMASLVGLKAPTRRVSRGTMRFIATLLEYTSKVTGNRPLLDRSQVDEFAETYAYYDCGKAQKELGYTHRSAEDTLRRTVAWAVDNGFVPEKRMKALTLHESLAGAY